MTRVRRRASSVTASRGAAARISVLSAGSGGGSGSPLSFAAGRRGGGGGGGGAAMPPAGAAISEAASYLYTAQHLLREGRPGRASDYLRSSLGLLAALVASGRLNDVITKGIAEAHLYLAKAALALDPHPAPPDDPVSHFRRAKMAFAAVKDRKAVAMQLRELERTRRAIVNSPRCIKLTRKLVDRIPHPLEEMGAMRHDLRPECYYYYYYQRCALPVDLHPALIFGRERASVEGGKQFRAAAPGAAALPTKGRRRMYLLGRRQWAPLKSGLGEVPGIDRAPPGSPARAARRERRSYQTPRAGAAAAGAHPLGRKSLGEAARAAAAQWRRRFSLGALGRGGRFGAAPGGGLGGEDFVAAQAARAAAKAAAAAARDSPTASSSATTDPSTVTSAATDDDDSLGRARARLRGRPAAGGPRRPPLAAPIPSTRREQWRREQRKVQAAQKRPQRLLSRLSHAIGVR